MGLTDSKPTGTKNISNNQPRFTKEQVLNHVDKVFKITATNKETTDSEFSQTLNWLTETFQEGGADLSSVVQNINKLNLSDINNNKINVEQLNKFLLQLGGGDNDVPTSESTGVTETLNYSNNSSTLMSASFSDRSNMSIRHKLAGGCGCAENSAQEPVSASYNSTNVFSETSINTINNMRGGNILSATSYSDMSNNFKGGNLPATSITESAMSKNNIIQNNILNEFNVNAFSETSLSHLNSLNQNGGAKKKKARKQKREEKREEKRDMRNRKEKKEDMDLELDTEEDELIDLDSEEDSSSDSSDKLENLEDESDETETMKMVRSESEKRGRKKNSERKESERRGNRRLARVLTDMEESDSSSDSLSSTDDESTGSSSTSSVSSPQMSRQKKSSKKAKKASKKGSKGKKSKKLMTESSMSEFNAIPFYSSDNSTDFYRSFESRNRFD